MQRVRVGLVADPAKPSEIARRLRDLRPPEGHGGRAWDIEVVSEPFTVATDDVGTALSRLTDGQQTAVLSLPALGGIRTNQRSRHAVGQLLSAMDDPAGEGSCRVLLPRRSGRWRLLRGMVVANRP